MSEEGASKVDMSSAQACSPRKMHQKRGIDRKCVGIGGACRGRLIGRSRVEGVGVLACSSPHLSSAPAGRAKLRSTAPAS